MLTLLGGGSNQYVDVLSSEFQLFTIVYSITINQIYVKRPPLFRDDICCHFYETQRSTRS